jgi:hypothetical protein
VKTYLRSDSSKKLKLIASLVASSHVCTFTKYTFKLNSLLLKRQKKNSLRNNTSAKHSIKQQTFTNAYLLICHHKKRRNSMTYSTNIDSFSKAPLDSYPMPSITNYPNALKGLLTLLPLISTWDSGQCIPLDRPSQCLIILPWGKYCYLCLSMGLACSLDKYQEKMSELFINMISIIFYEDDILVLTSSSFDDHL